MKISIDTNQIFNFNQPRNVSTSISTKNRKKSAYSGYTLGNRESIQFILNRARNLRIAMFSSTLDPTQAKNEWISSNQKVKITNCQVFKIITPRVNILSRNKRIIDRSENNQKGQIQKMNTDFSISSTKHL